MNVVFGISMHFHSLLALIFLLVAHETLWAQSSKGRPSRKPGEIITKPDMQGGFPSDRLEVGAPAPEFTLPRLTRQGEPASDVSLQQLRAEKPVVLIFGSMTCPPFKAQLNGINGVYETFRDRAEFLFVYVREAHPDSVLAVVDERNKEALKKIPQPTSLGERAENASICRQTLALKLPMAIDRPDNAVQLAYAGWPNRMVVVGTDGKVLFKSVTGPRSTDAERLRDWLKAHLP